MMIRRPRIYHSGKTFRERLFAHHIACSGHGELIFGFSRHCFSTIHRDMIALLKDTREALDLDARFKRIERLRQLDEAVDYLSDEKYREALERQHPQSRSSAEPTFLRVHPERD